MLPYLERLLAGASVEYKPLGEVAEITDGYPLNAKELQSHGQYNVIKIGNIVNGAVTQSEVYLSILPSKLKTSQIIQGGEILVGLSGSTGKTGYNTLKNAIVNQRIAIIRNKESIVSNGFLKHILVNSTFEEYCFKRGTGPQNNLSKSDLISYLIPIPPRHVQEEVVRILDKFSALTAELEAELELRRKQYAYYREYLLNFDKPNGGGGGQNSVKYLPLGEVFEMRNGYTPSKSNPEFWEGGTIPWFRMEDLRLSGGVLSHSVQYITPKAVKGKGLFKAGSIIMATTATIGEHALLIADSLANQRFTNFKIRKSLAGALLPKFVYYYFFIIDEWCKRNVNVSSFPSVDMEALKKLLIPIPSVQEQERIVGILDKFEALTEGITEGLPYEIALRRKQYAYYRDALLSFE